MQVLSKANPQNVANTLWAAAILSVDLPEGVVQQLVQHFMQVLSKANPQNVANTLWAVSSMGRHTPAHQLQQLLANLQGQLPVCSPQDIANTLLACGRMQYAPLQLLLALQQRSVLLTGMLAAALPQHLANMACACGQLGYKGKVLPGVLLLQDSKRGSFNMQNLSNLSWCAAVLDLQQYVPQVLRAAAATVHMWANAAADNFASCTRCTCGCWLAAPGQGLLGVLSQQQLQRCKDSWEQQLTARTAAAKASDLHRSVFAAVQLHYQRTPGSTPLSSSSARLMHPSA
jgi:hypothetical protein